MKDDIRIEEIFPRSAMVASSVWIGPANARTGLHYDFLNNIAMVIGGHKRFHLASPGTIERIGQMSNKFDRWSKVAAISFEALANIDPVDGKFYTVDLLPGDAVYIPAGWWHEVVNLKPSVLLSGFFDKRFSVITLWMYTGLLQTLHNLSLRHPRNCTCHQQLDL